MQLTEEFITSVIPDARILYKKYKNPVSFSIDSRTIEKGEIFVPLEGKNCDGHTFIKDVLVNKEAAGSLISFEKENLLSEIDQKVLKNKCIISVPHTKNALIALATAWREQFSYPVVGITGSIGKTSTKEIVCNILDVAQKPYIASFANRNTELGLALSILNMRSDHEVAVFELGISRRGEMKRLVSLVKPTIGVITGIGHCHMEGLGSIADIAAEKRDIFSLFKEDNIGVINGDQPLLSNVGYPHPIVRFGSKTTNQIQARKININNNCTTFVLKLYKEKFNILLKSIHRGSVFNALAAVAVGYLLKVSSETIVKAIQIPLVVANRFEPKTISIKGSKTTFISDCYNASPESMKEALLAFEHCESQGPKIAVLGDMLELGINSPFWHRQLGRFLRKVPSLQKVFLVGSHTEWTKKTVPVGLEVHHYKNWKELVGPLKETLEENSSVLIKGSRAVELDKIIESF